MTRVLRASDITALLAAVDEPLEWLERGFRTAAASGASDAQRVRTDLPGPGTATALLPGLLPSIPAYTVKVNAKFPDAVPALRGVVCLHSLADGELLALLDSASVTAWRTGLAAALLTDRLSRPEARSLGIVGTGAQARCVLAGLRRLRRLDEIHLHDVDAGAARRFAADSARGAAPVVRLHAGARDVAAAADIVVLATWSRRPLLSLRDLRDGQHVTALGADEPGKRELAPDVTRGATVVVDDVALACGAGVVEAEAVDATAVDVLLGRHPGRASAGELTVFGPIGLPWQDLALTWPLYLAAGAAGVGSDIDLLA